MTNDIDFSADAAPSGPLPSDKLQRLGALCASLLEAQFAGAELDRRLAQKEEDIRKLSEEDIPELLRECGLTEVRLLDGTKVTIADELDCGLPKENPDLRARALAWLRANSLGGVIKTVVATAFGRGDEERARALVEALREQNLSATLSEDVHYQTLKSTLKAERAAGRDVPAEPFGLRPYTKTALTLPEGSPRPERIRKRK